MDIEELRISKLRNYLFGVITDIIGNNQYQINVDMLSDKIDNYSLDKIPTSSTVERWINGFEIHRDIYVFRSRMAYSQDVINNLSNIGFFELFESIIYSNNKAKQLPDIDGIENIQCLNCGYMNNADTNTCEFQIQLQITYTVGGVL